MCHWQRSDSGLALVGSHRVARNLQRTMGGRIVGSLQLSVYYRVFYQVTGPLLCEFHSALRISHYAAVTLNGGTRSASFEMTGVERLSHKVSREALWSLELET